MNTIKPEEIVTFLPKEIRESESKAELISHIIRGYRRLKLPQDKQLLEKIIQTDNSNYSIPDYVKNIQSVEYVHKTHDTNCNNCYQTTPVYPTNVQSDLCNDNRRCIDCKLEYSIVERTLRLPTSGTYRLVHQVLFSDEMVLARDETLIDYLVEWTIFQVDRNRARTSDVSQNQLNLDISLMNTLYTAARGAMIMKAIRIENHRLKTEPIKLSYDEFNNRYHTTTTTR